MVCILYLYSLLFILFFVTQISLGQDLTKLNGFKYGIVEDIIYEGTPINDLEFKEKISSALSDFGIMPLYKNDIFPDDLKQNPCLYPNHILQRKIQLYLYLVYP